jgi:hypothetical protein
MEQIKWPWEGEFKIPSDEEIAAMEWKEAVTNAAKILYERACNKDVEAQVFFLDRAITYHDREALDNPSEPACTTEDILACLLELIAASGEEQSGGGDCHADQGVEQEDQQETAEGFRGAGAG